MAEIQITHADIINELQRRFPREYEIVVLSLRGDLLAKRVDEYEASDTAKEVVN